MKIGIMTFHASYNCGSMLQAYALQQALTRRYDADVRIIDYSNWQQRMMYGLLDFRPRRSSLRDDLKKLPYLREIQSQRRDYQAFSDTFLKKTEKSYMRPAQLNGIEKDFDLLIAGGDQVWNICCGDHDDAYFLNFAHDVRKVAYSPSLGAQNILEKAPDPQVYRRYLEDFERISVREGNGKKWLEALTGRDVPVAADPVTLFTREEWCEMLPLEDVPGSYIFNYAIYFNRPETIAAIQKISQKLGMPVYVMDAKSYCLYRLSEYGIQRYPHSGPLAALSLMKNAALVLNQSFHGALLSALFERPFWAYHAPFIRSPQDDRTTFLLNQLDLEERYVNIDELVQRKELMPEDKREETLRRLSVMRENAYSYMDSFMQQEQRL